MEEKKNNFEKQWSPYKNILSEDLNAVKELTDLSTSTAIKLSDVKDEARALWASRRGLGQFPSANTRRNGKAK